VVTRKKKPANARPDIFDLVTGITEEDLEKTDARIKNLKQSLALVKLQRLCQEIELKGLVDSKVVTVTVGYEEKEVPVEAEWKRSVEAEHPRKT